ncbi:unnamed protein product [Nesidiocoris tenuis]|uniref:Uncharacterized protein n=1 Tax=Nesidiocoris tenuis TaxID=355587 RepID=A0A6H5HNI3_9HEMI|nr:unnamed protein product [Nesidiocoris tenuis]
MRAALEPRTSRRSSITRRPTVKRSKPNQSAPCTLGLPLCRKSSAPCRRAGRGKISKTRRRHRRIARRPNRSSFKTTKTINIKSRIANMYRSIISNTKAKPSPRSSTTPTSRRKCRARPKSVTRATSRSTVQKLTIMSTESATPVLARPFNHQQFQYLVVCKLSEQSYSRPV